MATPPDLPTSTPDMRSRARWGWVRTPSLRAEHVNAILADELAAVVVTGVLGDPEDAAGRGPLEMLAADGVYVLTSPGLRLDLVAVATPDTVLRVYRRRWLFEDERHRNADGSFDPFGVIVGVEFSPVPVRPGDLLVTEARCFRAAHGGIALREAQTTLAAGEFSDIDLEDLR